MRAGSDHFRNEQGTAHLREEPKPERPEVPDYVTYPVRFITHKWYKPILTGILYFIFDIILNMAVFIVAALVFKRDISTVTDIASGGYDNLDVYTPLGAFINLGGIAVMIPALALANLIVGGRSFKSYKSSRGGWDHGIFFKCLLIAFITVALPIAADEIFHYGRMGVNQFTLAGLIMLTILGPMQCIAEEFVFRGLLVQTLGSWVRFAPVAIVLSAVVFAAEHPYNTIGVIDIFISGCLFGVAAWAGRGIEVSSALHIANNMAIFYCVGAGYGFISSQVEVRDIIFTACTYSAYVIIILICRKRGMFDKVKQDDAAKWNAKAMAKREMRAPAAGGGQDEF